MALLKGCCGNLNESGLVTKRLEILRATVAHTGTKSAEQPEYGILNQSLISNTAFYTFRNKLLGVALEIAVLAAVLHGCD